MLCNTCNHSLHLLDPQPNFSLSDVVGDCHWSQDDFCVENILNHFFGLLAVCTGTCASLPSPICDRHSVAQVVGT